MKKLHISQQMCLFLFYGTFTIMVLALLFAYIYHFNSQNVLHEATIKQANICASVRDSVKTELDDMSTISLNLVYSSAIRKNFSSFASYAVKKSQSKDDVLRSRDNAMAIYDVITAMIGSYQSASQVNLYTMDGTRVSSGYQQSVTKVDLPQLPWYSKVMALNGFKYISAPTVNMSLPATGANRDAHRFFSMTRMFFNEKDQPEGMFEVVQDCSSVLSLASKMEETNSNLYLYVYNDRGELVYPYVTVSTHADYLSLIRKEQSSDEQGHMLSTSETTGQFITWDTVPQYNWKVVAVESKDTIYASLSTFRTSFFFLTAVVLMGTLVVCFFLARQMTRPLSKLTRATKRLTMDSVLNDSKTTLTSADSNITEISDLCSAFLNMYDKLRISSRDLLLAHSEEIRANLQATQSLVNPHFLYNSLTSISVLAEDGEDETVVRMCNALCDYFRYISDSERTRVPLREELDCTKKYIDCMQIRFGSAFSFTYEVSSDVEAIRIPKLIVQPIVENVFKYAFNSAPPWKLNLYAETDGEFWQIRVEDNGGHLTDKRREEILQELHHMDHTEELRRMRIGGMGLKNVYLRLTLQYGEKAIFDIDNKQPGKTAFLIGGPVLAETEDKNGSATDL